MDKKAKSVLREFSSLLESMTMNLEGSDAYPHLRKEFEKRLNEDRRKVQFLLPEVKKILGLK